jgi:hypothetical protein
VLVLAGVFALGAAIWPGPKPPPDPQDVFRDRLRAGETVVLIGESECPEWLKENWLVHPGTLYRSAAAGGACAFESLQPSLLAFLRDPGVGSYRVKAQLRIMRSALARKHDKPPDIHEVAEHGVGLFFGHVHATGADGSEAHGFLNANFVDYLSPEVVAAGIKKGFAQLDTGLIVVRPNAPPDHPRTTPDDLIWFDRVASLPGEWREIVVEVRPRGVKAFWAARPGGPLELLAELRADQVAGQYAGFSQHWLNTYRPASGLLLPDWAPRAPFGVWSSSGTAVAVRNVTVEPLP